MANYVKIQLRRGDADAWKTTNPTLVIGEAGIDMTNHRFKVGDGSKAWNALPYMYDDVYSTLDALIKMVSGISGNGTFLGAAATTAEASSKYPNPTAGSTVFIEADKKLYYWTGSAWQPVAASESGLNEAAVKTIVRDMIKNDATVKQDVEALIAGAYKWGMSYTVNTYNGYSKPTKITYEDGVTATLAYAGGTQLTSITFSDGTKKTVNYNENGTVSGETVTRS